MSDKGFTKDDVLAWVCTSKIPPTTHGRAKHMQSQMPTTVCNKAGVELVWVWTMSVKGHIKG